MDQCCCILFRLSCHCPRSSHLGKKLTWFYYTRSVSRSSKYRLLDFGNQTIANTLADETNFRMVSCTFQFVWIDKTDPFLDKGKLFLSSTCNYRMNKVNLCWVSRCTGTNRFHTISWCNVNLIWINHVHFVCGITRNEQYFYMTPGYQPVPVKMCHQILFPSGIIIRTNLPPTS